MTHQHTNRDGGRKETVNWLEVRIPGDGTYPMDRISRGGWHDGSSRHATLELFDPRRAAFDSLRVLAWTGYVDQAAAGLDILMHPQVNHAPVQAELRYMPPVLDVDTASYDDIYKSLNAIKHAILPYTEMVLLVGDQQTYERLFHLKSKRNASHRWLVPLPGEWHYVVHALMAIHALWWTPFIESFIEHLSFGKSIKYPWKSVETYVYYDRVYQLIIGELVKYVAGVVPRAYRQQPKRLLELVRSNPTAIYALTFLFEFGLPWLRLRHAIRTNDHAVIDVMWTYTFHWCAAHSPPLHSCYARAPSFAWQVPRGRLARQVQVLAAVRLRYLLRTLDEAAAARGLDTDANCVSPRPPRAQRPVRPRVREAEPGV